MLDKNKKSIGIILVFILVVCLFPPTRLCGEKCIDNIYPSFVYDVIIKKSMQDIMVKTMQPFTINICWDTLLLEILILTIIGAIFILFKHK